MNRPRLSPSICLFILCVLLSRGVHVSSALAAGPAFDCSKAEAGSIEAMICADQELAALDRKLADVYGQAVKKAVNEHPPVLKAEQRGWIKGRNDCWKSDDRHRCVADRYSLRIVELQARYRLVAASGPVTYRCNNNSQDEVVVTFFQTDPPTLIAERGDQVSLMVQQSSASGGPDTRAATSRCGSITARC